MNMVFKLLIFSITLNFATGIMITALPDIFGDENAVNRGGLEYNESYVSDFSNEFNKSVNPSEQLEDTSNFLDRILDKITIGVWGKVLSAINKYMYGIVQVFDITIGRFMNLDMRGFWFGATPEHPIGILRTIISIGYVIGAIYLWTGRDLRT